MAKTKNALTILDAVTGNDASVRKGIADARINLEVAQMIYDARVGAGLSQRQLAELIGSKQPVIARLEDADYEGHSLTMLQRIAEALQRRLEVRFVPSSTRRASKATLRAQQGRKLRPAAPSSEAASVRR
jgi:transcriptional regulator with XRE-family HTH domain